MKICSVFNTNDGVLGSNFPLKNKNTLFKIFVIFVHRNMVVPNFVSLG